MYHADPLLPSDAVHKLCPTLRNSVQLGVCSDWFCLLYGICAPSSNDLPCYQSSLLVVQVQVHQKSEEEEVRKDGKAK